MGLPRAGPPRPVLQVRFLQDSGDPPDGRRIILPTAPVARARGQALHPDLGGELQQFSPGSLKVCQLLRGQLQRCRRLLPYGWGRHQRSWVIDLSRQGAPG
ncbi:hypothetical protein ACIPY2_19725 [Paenarthrobacter sp. NPDC089675]|uniref:hypothetical protein n=1 Tax=Paenarthrobacter TaxID=1742992 RepID=UPI00381A7EF0